MMHFSWKKYEILTKAEHFSLKICYSQLEEFDYFPNHLLKIKDFQDQLESVDRTVEEEDMEALTLKSLPSSYANFIETLNITSTNQNLTFEQWRTKLSQQDR